MKICIYRQELTFKSTSLLVSNKLSVYNQFTSSGTIEYEADLKHKNEMKRLEAELRGK